MTTHPLDVLYPYAGPCMICGGPDKRHRLADAIVANVRGGDSMKVAADIYQVNEEAVRTLVSAADRYARQHRRRWS